jgi:GNAT superfamily N-acetyltransferase
MEHQAAKIRPTFLERIGHFLRGPNPLHPDLWEGRLKPLTFRRFEVADLPQCMELYKLNEPGRFPEGPGDHYEDCLRSGRTYVLVAEDAGRIVAAGGMNYFVKPHIAVCSYGLVRPDHQGKGIGTALFLARLTLLGNTEPVYRVMIFAVRKSYVFYQRFGFLPFTPWHDKQGVAHPSGYLLVSNAEVVRIRKLLADHGISVPHDEDKVPFVQKEEE